MQLITHELLGHICSSLNPRLGNCRDLTAKPENDDERAGVIGTKVCISPAMSIYTHHLILIVTK